MNGEAKCDRCNETSPQHPNWVRVLLQRDGHDFEAFWCPKCSLVLWDQLAELSTFREVAKTPSQPSQTLKTLMQMMYFR